MQQVASRRKRALASTDSAFWVCFSPFALGGGSTCSSWSLLFIFLPCLCKALGLLYINSLSYLNWRTKLMPYLSKTKRVYYILCLQNHCTFDQLGLWEDFGLCYIFLLLGARHFRQMYLVCDILIIYRERLILQVTITNDDWVHFSTISHETIYLSTLNYQSHSLLNYG